MACLVLGVQTRNHRHVDMVRSATGRIPTCRCARAEMATTQWPAEKGSHRGDLEDRNPAVCGSWELEGFSSEGPAPSKENSEKSRQKAA